MSSYRFILTPPGLSDIAQLPAPPVHIAKAASALAHFVTVPTPDDDEAKLDDVRLIRQGLNEAIAMGAYADDYIAELPVWAQLKTLTIIDGIEMVIDLPELAGVLRKLLNQR